MDSRESLVLPCILSAVELLAFIGMSAFSAAGKLPTGQTLSAYNVLAEFLPNFGNLVIAIATTWYVVFTYYILRANAQLARQSVEPYLSVRWSLASSASDQQFTNLDTLTNLMRARLGLVGNPVALEIPDRFVNIVLENQRGTAIGSLKANIQFEFPDKEFNIAPLALQYQLSKTIGPKETVVATVVDLACVPVRVKVDLHILSIEYSAIDSRKMLTDYYGNNLYNAAGRLTLQVAAPLPKQEQAQ